MNLLGKFSLLSTKIMAVWHECLPEDKQIYINGSNAYYIAPLDYFTPRDGSCLITDKDSPLTYESVIRSFYKDTEILNWLV